MNDYYNQNYTREEINTILAKIKDCIRSNRFIISLNNNRKENIDFINKYNLRTKSQKEILLNIEVEDFCHSLHNTKRGYENEILYVFAPRVRLSHVGKCELVSIYTKFNIITISQQNRTVVVSFHKANKRINYLFKQTNRTIKEY